MKWMKERDLLIAQTMEFVQSVTGKRPEPAVPDVPVAVERAAVPPVVADVVARRADPPALTQPPKPIEIPRADIPADFQAEIKARIANFRAHQQRFLREREAYCSATMDKVRAALREGAEPARPDK